jgi:YaaC-like Protein
LSPKVTPNTGWEKRLEILRRTAEDRILGPLRVHNWTAQIIREVSDGDYIVIEAARGDQKHRVALLFSSATDNSHYKILEPEVDQFFTYGALYHVESFAYGISKPVMTAASFHHLLIKWNAESSQGKFAPGADKVFFDAKPQKEQRVVAEQPLQAIWLRLRQLESVTLAKKMLSEKAKAAGSAIDDDAAQSKAEGIAFSIRNGADYFRAGQSQNVTQRILNLYYGVMSFAFAEILASLDGPSSLEEVQNKTKQGHGLFTQEDETDPSIGRIAVGVISQGFFYEWLKVLGVSVDGVPGKKPRKYSDLSGGANSYWNTLEQLFARVPEVSDFFLEIFESAPGFVVPIFDVAANQLGLHNHKDRPKVSYLNFLDRSARLTKEDIARLPAPLSQIIEVKNESGGRSFRAAVDFTGFDLHWDVLPLHRSFYRQQSILIPIFSSLNQYRVINLSILYALSIIVRYRPSVWRQVQEGDQDHMRAMIEAFLEVTERVIPEQFLQSILGRKILFNQPQSIF